VTYNSYIGYTLDKSRDSLRGLIYNETTNFYLYSTLQENDMEHIVLSVTEKNNDDSDSSDDGLEDGEIAGIVIGVTAFVAIVIFAGICIYRRCVAEEKNKPPISE
jgi:hypothetical protein